VFSWQLVEKIIKKLIYNAKKMMYWFIKKKVLFFFRPFRVQTSGACFSSENSRVLKTLEFYKSPPRIP